jgi:phosphotriesterase-related protein
MRIETVLGPIDPSELGVTDAHDHLITIGGGEVRADPDLALPSVEAAVQELSEFHRSGGQALVEMGVIGIGRSIEHVIEVAKRVPQVHIIAATGFHRTAFYEVTDWVYHYSVDEIAELIVSEITEGIEIHCYNGPLVKRSSAKAGVIKLGTSYNCITELEKKLFLAVAIAHRATGAPISTHTEAGTMGIEQLALLKEHGVKPERVIIGHLDRCPDFWYHKKIAAEGAYVLYTGASRVKYWPDEVQVNLIKRMVKAGFGKHILLGMDMGRASYWRAYGGGPGMSYLLTRFIPRLLESGVSEKAVEDMLINNPRQVFAF